ncbi:hypothetical protein FRC08_002830 [Ceratobasidium sp. 394]|nr:hypothetical protein FRC08_002830 [Ceratobasidium sp. 394]
MGMAFVPPKKTEEDLSAHRHRNRDIAHWSVFLTNDRDLHALATIFAKGLLPRGSPEFIGLGFLSFITIVLVELFGSPFLKNASIVVGLLVGSIVAGAAG